VGRLDASFAYGCAIMILNAMNPDAAHLAYGAIGNNSCVFDGNVALIIETIRDPDSQRFRSELAFVHRDMEGVFVVVNARTDGAHFPDKHFRIPK
jgi:hypothetical protein